MRLICPNCSAQYEIDGSLIPAEGRDVQCSNCGNTWFEAAPAPEAAPVVDEDDWARADATLDIDDDDIMEAEPEVTPDPAPAAEPVSAAAPQADWRESEEPVEDTDTADEDTALPDRDLPPRRPVDAAAVDILKEEAAREMTARGAPAAPLETQADLSLDDDIDEPGPSRSWRARISRIEDAEDLDRRAAEIDERQAYGRSKSDLLPDIEDINSSLSSTRGRSGAATEDRASFRSGFGLAMSVALVLLLGYVFAPSIVAAVPAVEGFMVAYVDAANGARDAIDGIFGG